MTNLSAALLTRFERYGAAADLDDSIVQGRRGAEYPGQAATEQARCSSNLAGALLSRFDLRGAAEDIDEAVRAARQGTNLVPAGHVDRPSYLTNLSIFLQARFTRAERDADLLDAIAAMQDAVTATPAGSPALPSRLSNLCIVRQTRYLRIGDLADLDAAIDAGIRSVEGAGETDPARHSRMSNLALALLRRFERRRQPEDLAQAAQLGAESVAAAQPGSPGRARSLMNLGSIHEIGGGADDLRRARDCWWCAASTPTAAVGVRTIAAASWGRAAARLEARADAADAYAAAVGLLAVMSWPGTRRGDQEHALAGWSGLARDAAATAVAAHRPRRAVSLLEEGRGILWSRTLDRRIDLTALERREPELARSLERVRYALSRSDQPDQPAAIAESHNRSRIGNIGVSTTRGR